MDSGQSSSERHSHGGRGGHGGRGNRGNRGGRGIGRHSRHNGNRSRAAQGTDEASDDEAAQDPPGVNKLKAALRQTRRLLARDKLKADARQEAERKLVALESELESRQEAQKERKNATRYHKVRFFERQKLTRRIAKLKRQEQNDKTREDLQQSRVQLNYVLHFPMSQRYIALFPNSGTSPLDKDTSAADQRSVEDSKTAKRAQSIMADMAASMESGELSVEPELELQERGMESPAKSLPSSSRKRKDIPRHAEPSLKKRPKQAAASTMTKKKNSSKVPSASEKKGENAATSLADDDFFA